MFPPAVAQEAPPAGTSPVARGHLVISRRDRESVMIGDDIEIVVLAVSRDKVKLGVDAPRSVKVLRTEVHRALRDQP
jgi:carbon storage regulator